jgi:predicted ester cyclase
MTDASAVQKAMFDAVLARDWDGLRGLYHADYTYMDGSGAEQSGGEAGVGVARMYTDAFPDLTFTTRNHWSPAPDVAILEFTARGTHLGELHGIAPTGRSIEGVVCNIVETQDGKIVSEREYYDTASLLEQLGVTGS